MKIISKISELREAVRQLKISEENIGLVPTMGCFHEGHLSLMRRAGEENDVMIVSVFVNPAQFAEGEDLDGYPRDAEGDAALAKKEGADYLFTPSVEEMYPAGYRTYVEVENLGKKLCGRSRPGHFRGVATVVAKLINICMPDALYLGQKDAQQAFILRRMARDLNMDVEVRILPTVREEDGLAMSSRNRYLAPDERASAPALYRAISEAKKTAEGGEKNREKLIKQIRESLSGVPGMDIDYVEIVSADELEPVQEVECPAVLAAAVNLGSARLIDNILINCEEL